MSALAQGVLAGGRRVELRTAQPEETAEVAAAIARLLEPGDVVSLSGELGAGKTVFVRGAAQALGVRRKVTSPTFTLVRSYRGDVDLVHVDVYRLDRLQEVVELGEDTLMGPDQVTFIEWGDTMEALLPPDWLEVTLLLGEQEQDRLVRLQGHGTWAARMDELATLLSSWSEDGVQGAGPTLGAEPPSKESG